MSEFEGGYSNFLSEIEAEYEQSQRSLKRS